MRVYVRVMWLFTRIIVASMIAYVRVVVVVVLSLARVSPLFFQFARRHGCREKEEEEQEERQQQNDDDEQQQRRVVVVVIVVANERPEEVSASQVSPVSFVFEGGFHRVLSPPGSDVV